MHLARADARASVLGPPAEGVAAEQDQQDEHDRDRDQTADNKDHERNRSPARLASAGGSSSCVATALSTTTARPFRDGPSSLSGSTQMS